MYIDRDRAEKVFNQYVENYNNNDGKIKLKIEHTYRVSELCERIATKRGLSKEDIDLSYLTGLLHDIGRFEQVKRYGTFVDAISIDHAKLGAEILFEDGKIRDFIDDSSKDELIKSVISYHNVYEIPNYVSEEVATFSKILRDADKIDIFMVNIIEPAEDVYGVSKEDVLNSTITKEVLESFKKRETVPRKLKKSAVDNVVCHIAYVFGTYFKESIDILIKEGYFKRLLNFKSNLEITNNQFNEIRKVVNNYLNERVKICYPDYNNSILSVSNSILKYYGAEYNHNTMKEVDEELNKDYKNVIHMVFDAMGSRNLESLLPEESFLRKHMVKEISSVFPTTTTAAVPTIDSGLAPIEHSWLGWSMYFSELDKNVMLFINKDDNNEVAADYHVARKYIPYKSVVEKINEVGSSKASKVSPYEGNVANNLYELVNEVEKVCKNNHKNYIYAYCEEPDHSMHLHGVDSEEARYWFNEIDKAIEELSNKLMDTLIIITADHGHINVKSKLLSNYSDIDKCLIRKPSLEPRCINFFIKDGMEETFKKAFNNEFEKDYILLTKEEVINRGLLGYGKMNNKISKFLGDYIAIGIGDLTLFYDETQYKLFKGMHAGLTEEEMKVPLIIIPKK